MVSYDDSQIPALLRGIGEKKYLKMHYLEDCCTPYDAEEHVFTKEDYRKEITSNEIQNGEH